MIKRNKTNPFFTLHNIFGTHTDLWFSYSNMVVKRNTCIIHRSGKHIWYQQQILWIHIDGLHVLNWFILLFWFEVLKIWIWKATIIYLSLHWALWLEYLSYKIAINIFSEIHCAWKRGGGVVAILYDKTDNLTSFYYISCKVVFIQTTHSDTALYIN